VNDEFGALRELLQQTPSVLNPGGRLAIITFHSLEVRIVKTFFKDGTFSETEADELYGGKIENPFTVITKKPLLPTAEEMKRNSRSRSAKLRVVEKK
jgi:16S rRNA (cytosine1402-N4)-methyltransferase